ncbi:hypothetical protein GCM10009853_016810 [Glycomyces scopariae]|uniref:D-alanyl-D-alanine carboxypeptidase n=1 Tax=Glycomyces sambucus TaxID=380244 RepID=A0A1G9I2J4_9ACTN|nr:hypothetical protein [Glycomyces sambucus]SDL19033.1 hypothetical protein SAMN05216298_2974 [Glycomyces sambucus]
MTTTTFSAQDVTTIRTAAWGAVSLMSAAGIAGSAHRVGTDASLALVAATGPVGHVVASAKGAKLKGKSTAELADQVFPALTASVALLEARDPAEAEEFRSLIGIVVEAANRAHRGGPSPVMDDMSRKIAEAMNA